MKEQIVTWLSKPENLILLGVGLIQVYKLLKGYIPESWTKRIDKAGEFLGWGINSAYHTVEALEKSNVIDPKSKFSVWLDKLFELATKQGVDLTMAEIIKAKAIVEATAQASKAPATLPIPGPKAGEPSKVQ